MCENEKCPLVPLSEVLIQDEEYVTELEPRLYPKLSVKLYGKGVVLDEPADGATIRMKRHQFAKPGQVILSEIWAKKGAIGIVSEEGAGALVTSHFFLFNIDETRLSRPYMGWLLAANYFEPVLSGEARGTTGYAAVRPKQFLACKIPLPNLHEQRRIVARIAELAALIKEARELRIKAREEAAAVWDSATIEIFRAQSSVERIPIDDLAEVRGGIQKGPHRIPVNNPVRYLTVAHVQRNHISLSDPRFFEVSPEELHQWLLRPGDVLIIEGNGSASQIGRTALFRGEIAPCVHQNHVIRIRPDKRRIDPEYLNIYLNSPIGQDEVQSRSRTTSGLRTLSIGRIKQIAVPVPSLSEQRRIVAYLDGLQAQVDELTTLQEAAQAELNALLPSALDKAFRGEL